MALRPFLSFFLAALAALHQVLLVESCAARNLETRSTTRVVKSTTPKLLSLKFGEALFLRLEALPSNAVGSVSNSLQAPSTSTESNRKTTASSSMYTNRYDHVAIEYVLNSPRLLKNFHWCIMGRGPCTSEGSELKRIIPEALKSDCARCTETQKVQAGKVLIYLIQHRPEWWKELLEKYDPDGSIRRQYEYESD